MRYNDIEVSKFKERYKESEAFKGSDLPEELNPQSKEIYDYMGSFLAQRFGQCKKRIMDEYEEIEFWKELLYHNLKNMQETYQIENKPE